jgi:hypothetical protein
MPQRRTVEKARKDRRAGKSATTQAGEFVHEEVRKVRRGEHGVRSPQQAVAIGLSKARRAGVALRPPRKGKAKASTRKSAEYAYEARPGQAEASTPAARLACRVRGAQARTAQHGVARRALEANAARRRAPPRLCSFCRSQESRKDKRRRWPLCRRQESGANQSASPTIARAGR